jgi:hypothetical protein
LKEEETSQSTRFLRLEAGTLKERNRNGWDIERDNRILELKCKFLQDKIAIDNYLMLISKNMPDFE